MRKISKITLLEMGVLMALLSTCKKATVQSAWNDGSIIIDAVVKDWGSRLVWNEKSQVNLGVTNDAENLYLCLVTSDPDIHRQILINGFIVGIDQKGSKSHHFGIKFPLGISDRGNQPLMPTDDQRRQKPFEPGQPGQKGRENDFWLNLMNSKPSLFCWDQVINKKRLFLWKTTWDWKSKSDSIASNLSMS